MKTDQRAFAPIPVIAILVLVGLLGWGATKTIPAFNKDSRNAKKGEKTTTELVAAGNAVGAAQTASAQVIGEAVADMPASENRSFVLNEIPIMLARGPAPDPKQIIAARDRRIAFLEGNLAAQEKLTDKALKDAGELRSQLAEATSAKQASDQVATVAAAEKLAANRTSIGLGILLAIAVIAFLWLRSWMHGNTLSFSGLGEISAMVHKGEASLEQAMDSVVDRRNWDKVAKAIDAHFSREDVKPGP